MTASPKMNKIFFMPRISDIYVISLLTKYARFLMMWLRSLNYFAGDDAAACFLSVFAGFMQTIQL